MKVAASVAGASVTIIAEQTGATRSALRARKDVQFSGTDPGCTDSL